MEEQGPGSSTQAVGGHALVGQWVLHRHGVVLQVAVHHRLRLGEQGQETQPYLP